MIKVNKRCRNFHTFRDGVVGKDCYLLNCSKSFSNLLGPTYLLNQTNKKNLGLVKKENWSAWLITLKKKKKTTKCWILSVTKVIHCTFLITAISLYHCIELPFKIFKTILLSKFCNFSQVPNFYGDCLLSKVRKIYYIKGMKLGNKGPFQNS